jgi:hypothetical protein
MRGASPQKVYFQDGFQQVFEVFGGELPAS